MISTFQLKFGRAPGVLATPIDATPVTVFVGPNNSGKSKVLSEIERYCRNGMKDVAAVILEDLTFPGLTANEAARAIEHITQKRNPGESLLVNHIFVGSHGFRQQVPLNDLMQALQNPASRINIFCQWFLTHSTLMLNGQNRINLINQQPAGDLQQAPKSSFQVLFRDDEKRREVRRIVSEAFGFYFVIDPTNLGNLRIRLSQRIPASDLEERGIHVVLII